MIFNLYVITKRFFLHIDDDNNEQCLTVYGRHNIIPASVETKNFSSLRMRLIISAGKDINLNFSLSFYILRFAF
jgi:hypothetical protein